MVQEMYDIIVVGAGHAGCEAALAAGRRGDNVLLITISIDKIAYMSCNPAIGGLAKGALVKDLDALGGEMAKNIDATAIQFQILNQNKGVAAKASRAQADKKHYSDRMRKIIFNERNITVKQGIVSDILTDKDENRVSGIRTLSNEIYLAKKIVLAMGTFLNGKIYIGDRSYDGGRMNDIASTDLTNSINSLGFKSIRLKTGTPARVDKRTINFNKLIKYEAEISRKGFSFESNDIKEDQICCYLAYTKEATHKIVKDNMARSIYFSSSDKALGTRYCPSMEDKVSKFPDRERHQLVLEQEGLDSNEIYINGFSSSLPVDAQLEAYRSIDGLENAEFIRPAYAIEYVAYQPLGLKLNYESKLIKDLYFAGQINGTSGYEEAAVQGFMAGVNASLALKGEAPFILRRDESYIGVLTDDLMTKGIDEPYRMFSSRAEYRMKLREDNAESRLLEYGKKLGLVSDERYGSYLSDKAKVSDEIERLRITRIKLNDIESINILKRHNIELTEGISCYSLLKRPHSSYRIIRELGLGLGDIEDRLAEEVEIAIFYEGYIKKEEMEIVKFQKLESIKIPKDIDYSMLSGLRLEQIEKLTAIRPETLGQAMRIHGLTNNAINILEINIIKLRKTKQNMAIGKDK